MLLPTLWPGLSRVDGVDGGREGVLRVASEAGDPAAPKYPGVRLHGELQEKCCGWDQGRREVVEASAQVGGRCGGGGSCVVVVGADVFAGFRGKEISLENFRTPKIGEKGLKSDATGVRRGSDHRDRLDGTGLLSPP